MLGGVSEVGGLTGLSWARLVVAGGAGLALWLLGLRLRLRAGYRRDQRRVEREMLAYAGLNLRLPADGEATELAVRVSRLIAGKSAFRRVAVLLRGADGRVSVAASVGMEESAVGLVEAWAEGLSTEVRRGERGLGVRVGGRSFAVVLGKRPVETGYLRAVVTPLWTTGGRLLGALVVGADGVMSVRRSALAKALEPMELLAMKVERVLENAALAERLLRAERLAGLGLMAGGMAHALNDPLTAVLGFAELIADTTGESRVRQDAGVIVREALRMRETVEMVLEYLRPAAECGTLVDVAEVVRELAGVCGEELESRGVRLEVLLGDGVALVRGSRERVRLLLEHLMNNAAEALGRVDAGEERVLRVEVGLELEMVRVVVRDTGVGFREPGRVFALGNSPGMGLSVCFGIVREMGGEISAFNVRPHGAAVMVELPAADFAGKKSGAGVGERVMA
jgi:signal transduction histidine kinase